MSAKRREKKKTTNKAKKKKKVKKLYKTQRTLKSNSSIRHFLHFVFHILSTHHAYISVQHYINLKQDKQKIIYLNKMFLILNQIPLQIQTNPFTIGYRRNYLLL